MKIGIYIITILISLTTCFGQNLVPNPSFENYKQLPCRLSEFKIQDLLEDWFQPLTTTTDYWNTKAPESCFAHATAKYGLPRTGNGMAGMFTIITGRPAFMGEYREYLEVELLQPLKQGQLYELEFFVSITKETIDPCDLLQANNLGASLSVQKIHDLSDNSPVSLNLPTKLNENEIITGAGGWHRITGCIYADSAYRYLLIGNFKPSIITKTVRLTNNHQEGCAYYFVDDVSLVETPYNLAHLQAEKTLCYNQNSVLLDATTPGALSYLWQNGISQSQLNVTERVSRDYSVKMEFDVCSYEQTFTVKYVPDVVLQGDTLLCRGESITLSQNYHSGKLIWWDGTTDSTKLITQSGTYWATVNNLCMPMDSIKVDFIECPGFIPNVITPNNDEYNQVFEIENISNRSWSLKIYNRWGSLVYESKTYLNNWDGGDLPGGEYFYILNSTELNKSIKGWVSLLH
ncbi:MAG: gliding motility-associated C-terminal domain-containing protein [Cyclobacteriaceae bacterium]|nr:gliding motility-associated C-terminal domain-containing protein [Cyclobacteriaceae bacterium]